MADTYWNGGRAYQSGFPMHSKRLTDTEADAVNRAVERVNPDPIPVDLDAFKALMGDILAETLVDIRRLKSEGKI